MWPPQIITYSVFVRNLPPLRTFLLLFNSIWATVGSRHQSRTFDTPAARREFFITSTVWGTQLPLRPRIKTACNFTLYGIQTTNDDKSFVTTLDAKLDNKKKILSRLSIHHSVDRRVPNGLGQIRPHPLPTGRQSTYPRATINHRSNFAAAQFLPGSLSCTCTSGAISTHPTASIQSNPVR